MKYDETEIGYNFLDTTITGASSQALSGQNNPNFPMIFEDIGVAMTTAQGEFRGAN